MNTIFQNPVLTRLGFGAAAAGETPLLRPTDTAELPAGQIQHQ